MKNHQNPQLALYKPLTQLMMAILDPKQSFKVCALSPKLRVEEWILWTRTIRIVSESLVKSYCLK